MKKQDYYFFALSSVSLYLLIQLLTSFSVTNLIALFEYRQAFAYVAAGSTLLGVIFCFRNFVRAVSFFSGNYSETEHNTLIHAMAIDTIIILSLFTILSVANTYMFYFFNSVSF